MEKVKSSQENRIVSMEILRFSELPEKAKRKMPYYEYAEIKKFSYNAGGELVNYGLNTFVRDIFVYSKGYAAIYSDRFGNYYRVKDKEIIDCISSCKNLIVTDEGILVFYEKYSKDAIIYATLNLKSGILVPITSLTNNIGKEVTLYEIFTENGKTFVRVGICMDNTNMGKVKTAFYLFDFSYSFYESYGSSIKIKAYDLSEKVKTKEDITSDFKFDIETSKVSKNRNVLKLERDRSSYELKKLYSEFGKSYLNSNEKINSLNYEDTNIVCIYYNEGDIGINDCINSFVNHIKYGNIPIRKRFHFFEGYDCNLVIRYDRYKNMDFYRIDQNDIFDKILFNFSSVHYVSLEGVIVTLFSSYNHNDNLIAYISLDGFVWKSYNLTHLIDSNFKFAELTSKGNKNYITLYNNSDKNAQREKKEYMVDFVFNFWDLYGSPVEMIIDSV